ncbi:MAG: DoxX family protein [Chloroflexota bacterium]
MNIALWVLQAILTMIFLVAGFEKLAKSKDVLKKSERNAWVDSMSTSSIRLIGILEILIAIGLILPHLTGILPWLTPLAAVGFVCTMIGAAILHTQRGDGAQAIVTNIVMLLLAAFVAYGRFVLVPA